MFYMGLMKKKSVTPLNSVRIFPIIVFKIELVHITDKILIERIKQDDYSGFKHFFDRYYGRLCAYAQRIIPDKFAAEDVTQELFVKFWDQRHQIEIQGNVLGYLFRSLKNACLNYLRHEKSRKKTLENYLSSKNETGQDFLEEMEFISLVEECIEELPERSRQVFKMSRIDGYKQKEIAEKLHISVKTIKNQIWKSLQYIRSCLKLKDAL